MELMLVTQTILPATRSRCVWRRTELISSGGLFG